MILTRKPEFIIVIIKSTGTIAQFFPKNDFEIAMVDTLSEAPPEPDRHLADKIFSEHTELIKK